MLSGVNLVKERYASYLKHTVHEAGRMEHRQ